MFIIHLNTKCKRSNGQLTNNGELFIFAVRSEVEIIICSLQAKGFYLMLS